MGGCESLSDKFFVGLDLTGIEDNGIQRPISRVTLLLDDENSVTAGDDTGIELAADCPHATQAMADAILAQVKGYQYQMFGADDAALDPAAELGDGVTAGGVYSVISRLSDDGSGYSDITAPGESELEDEYPASGPMTQAFARKIARTNSRITKTAEEIRLEVEGLNGELSSIRQQVDGITLEVSNGPTSSTITLKSNAAIIASETIQMNGLVTFAGLSGGTTTINGACIKTGTIDADRLNLTGAISFGDLDGSMQQTINSASVASGWRYGNSTYIDGSMIAAGTVMASKLRGQYVYLDNSVGSSMGRFSITGADTAAAAVELESYGALRLKALSGAAYMEASSYNRYIRIQDMIYTRGPLVSNNMSSLGTGGYPWSDVYANNATIQASDLTVKKDVEYGLSRYDALFDALRPMSFLFVNGESGRRHLGLGAQDVERSMERCGVSDMEFAGFIKSPKEGGEGFAYALRYGELIPLCIEQIQRLKNRVDNLEKEARL